MVRTMIKTPRFKIHSDFGFIVICLPSIVFSLYKLLDYWRYNFGPDGEAKWQTNSPDEFSELPNFPAESVLIAVSIFIIWYGLYLLSWLNEKANGFRLFR